MTVEVELSKDIRVLVALAADVEVEVTVITVLVTLVTLPVALAAYSELNECSYRTCCELEYAAPPQVPTRV